MRTTHASAWKRTALVLLSTTAVALSGCDNDDSAPASDEEVVVIPTVALNSREDVIKAVASLWAYTQPYVATTAPTRPQPESGETEGQIVEDCGDSGSVSFDQDAGITTFDNCATAVESSSSSDDGEGNTVEEVVVLRTSVDGVISEDCAEDIQSTVDRCLSIVPLVSEASVETSQTQGEETTTTTLSERIDQATFIGIVDTETGYQLFIQDDRSDRSIDAEGNRSEFSTQTSDFRLSVSNAGDTDNPAFVLELDGEIELDDLADNSCASGLIRVGTGEVLSVDPAAGTAPSAGELLLSTADIGGLAVSFANNGDISFRLAGEALSATAEELSQACVARYETASEDDSDDGDSILSGCPFDPLACFPF